MYALSGLLARSSSLIKRCEAISMSFGFDRIAPSKINPLSCVPNESRQVDRSFGDRASCPRSFERGMLERRERLEKTLLFLRLRFL